MIRLDGLPLHPLVVHAPVVLLPLVAGGILLFLVVPRWRRVLGPILAGLALVAAGSAIAAAWSGEALGDELRHGDELDAHESLGERVRLFAVLLAAGTVALVAYERRPARRENVVVTGSAGVAAVGLAAVIVVAAAGHSGAQLAWSGRLPSTDGSGEQADGPDGASTAVPVDGGDAASAPRAGSGQPEVQVTLGEWALVTSVPEAPPGSITFRFRNAGTVAHAFRIRSAGSGRDRLEWRSEVVQPGQEATLTADLGAGSYDLDCPVEDGHGEHDALGMEAPFTVRGDAAPLTAPPADPAPTGSPSPDDTGAATVDIRQFEFEPAEISVKAGQQVTWVNGDPAPHTATGDGGDTGRLTEGGRGTLTFDRPGRYSYLCTVHPAMTGTVLVEP